MCGHCFHENVKLWNAESVLHLFGGPCLNKGKLQAGKVRLSDKKVSPLGVGRLQKVRVRGTHLEQLTCHK